MPTLNTGVTQTLDVKQKNQVDCFLTHVIWNPICSHKCIHIENTTNNKLRSYESARSNYKYISILIESPE